MQANTQTIQSWVTGIQEGTAQFRNLVYDRALRAPMCFALQAAREVLPFYELRTKLAMRGKNPDEIAEGGDRAQNRAQRHESRGKE